MCRMLGLIGNKPDYSLLAEFQKLAVVGKIRAGMEPGHFDGWGVAGYVNGKASYPRTSPEELNKAVRDVRPNALSYGLADLPVGLHFGRSTKAAHEDSDFLQAKDKLSKNKSKVFIAHIRKATGGSNCLENTHPFIKNGWIFCHNGTIYGAENIPIPLNLKPKGTTDSERFFYFLINRLRNCEQSEAPMNRGNAQITEARNDCYKAQIEKAIQYTKKKCDYTSLTFLLTNGKHLVAYRDYNEKSDEAEEFAGYYTLYLAQGDGFAAVCSEPIGNLKFRPLQNKELLILT